MIKEGYSVVSKRQRESKKENILEDLILQEKSLSSSDLELIINSFVKNGCKNEKGLLDFKESFEDSTKHWLNLIKDIVAASNSGGSLLIFGINNNNIIKGCERKIEKLFDPSKIQDKLKRYIYSNEIQVECTRLGYQGHDIYGLRIRPTGNLIIFDKSGQYEDNGKPKIVFREGVFYVRSNSESRPASQVELNEIVENMTLQRVKDLLAKIEKVAYAPQGSAISIVPPERSDMKLAVKFDPHNPEAIPISSILDDNPFTDLVQEATAQLKTWKSNREHTVKRSMLSKWYYSSKKPEWNEDLSIFCLHSALDTGGFTHYWAANISRADLEEMIITKIIRGKVIPFKAIVYLIPSFFWNERVAILQYMSQITDSITMKSLISKLTDIGSLKSYKRRARLDNANLKYEGKQVYFSKLKFEEAKDLFERIQDKESKSLLSSQERRLGHQLDIFLHTPPAMQDTSDNFLSRLEASERIGSISNKIDAVEKSLEVP